MTPLPALPEGFPRKGDVIAGKYQVEGVLGAGGMGVVVSAIHVALRQRVAVKFLFPAAMQIPDAAARFLREAQSAVAIQSEHVARVLDVGTLDTGSPYIVMEHLTGLDFWHMLKARGGPLPIPEAINLILQASEAIAEAHALGIVHRDLKLTNLFITTRPDGSPLVKVLDFGLSKVITPSDGSAVESSLTMTNVIVGSPHYMSPEQIRSLKHVDARTDIWALGVILYQIITARRPFKGDTLPSICMSIAIDAPTPIHTFQPDVPPSLDALICRCLEKDVTRRVQTVAELAQGLAPFAPPASQLSVERILKVASGSVSARAAVVAQPSVYSMPDPPTLPLSMWASVSLRKEVSDFLPWLRSFDDFVRTHKDKLGLDERSISAVFSSKSSLDEAVSRVDNARGLASMAERAAASARAELAEALMRRASSQEALRAVLVAKEQILQEALSMVQPIAARLQDHDNITNAIRRQMGILGATPSRSTSVPPETGSVPPAQPPSPPGNLLVLAQPNRVNVLQWQSPNEPGTSYLIEAAIGKMYRGSPIDPDTSAYKLVATVTDEATYRHVVGSVPAGVRVKYRIRAGRGYLLSRYSAEVLIACR